MSSIDRVTEYDLQYRAVRPPENLKPIYKIPQRQTNYDNKFGDLPKAPKVAVPLDFSQPTIVKKNYNRVLTFILTEDGDIGPQDEILKAPWACSLRSIQFTSDELGVANTRVNVQRCMQLSFENGPEAWETLLPADVVLNNSDPCVTVPINKIINKNDYLRLVLLSNEIVKPITVELIMVQEI